MEYQVYIFPEVSWALCCWRPCVLCDVSRHRRSPWGVVPI